MNIRQRIVLLVLLTFASLSAIGVYAVLRSHASEREVRTVTEGVVPSAAQAAAMMTQLKDVHITAMAMVTADTPQLAEQTHKELVQRKADLERSLEGQLASADSDAQRELVKIAKEGLSNYFSSIDETAKFKLAGQTEMAMATMAATVDQYLREQGEMMQTLQVEKSRSKDAAIAALNASLARTKLMLSAIAAAALGLTAVGGILLYRQVVLPIGKMEAKMTEIATHQDFSQRMPVSRMDEIGRSVVAFNTMIERIQASTEQVRQKTADMHAMLHGIPQGILMIGGDGRVHSEYSEHLRVILESDDLAGQDAMKLLFDDSDLGADARAQADAALGSCIGSDAMNFEFNSHLLPTEITKRMPNGAAKVLDLHWSAMTDADDVVTRLLLCLRDVTELRALARAAEAQRHELAIIGEIIAVQQEKFDDFIDGATDFMVQNTRLLDRMAQSQTRDEAERLDVLNQLFRNMHTVKGNARTHGLLSLANVVHMAEDRYDRLRKGDEVWDAQVLAEDLAQARSALESYASISRDKLGRSGPGRRGSVEKFVMVPKEQVQRLLEGLRPVDGANEAALRQALLDTRSALERVGTERLEDALAPVLESLPQLASDLGKASPVVSIEDGGILVRSQLVSVLRNAFVHLFRNALDHGIEAPDVRRAAGKAESGHIRLAASVERAGLQLTLEDDGRGLNLPRIEERAIARGLLQPGHASGVSDLAQLIFHSGFSTAEQVTNVSGRGVGMDAVKAFIEAEGGQIRLHVNGPTRADGSAPFQVRMTLPAQLAVRTGEIHREPAHA